MSISSQSPSLKERLTRKNQEKLNEVISYFFTYFRICYSFRLEDRLSMILQLLLLNQPLILKFNCYLTLTQKLYIWQPDHPT